MNKREKALYFCRNQVKNNSIYLWGGSGEKVKSLTAKKICTMETSEDNAKRVMAEIWKRVKNNTLTKHTKAYDCSGLQIKALQYAGVLPKGYDDTANGLLNYFDKINMKDIQAGDLIFKCYENGKAYHVAMYTGDGKGVIIEAQGRDKGVVESVIDSNYTEARRPFYD